MIDQIKLHPKCAATVSTEMVEQLPRDRESVAPPRVHRRASSLGPVHPTNRSRCSSIWLFNFTVKKDPGRLSEKFFVLFIQYQRLRRSLGYFSLSYFILKLTRSTCAKFKTRVEHIVLTIHTITSLLPRLSWAENFSSYQTPILVSVNFM